MGSLEQSRYISFMMGDEEGLKRGNVPYHEAISQDGSRVVVLPPSSKSEDTSSSIFDQSTWSLSNRAMPAKLDITTNVSTSLDRKRWDQAKSKSVSFTPKLDFLRIGSQVFAANNSGEYDKVGGLELSSENQDICFEEIASRASLLVVASRRKLPTMTESRGRESDRSERAIEKKTESSDTRASDSNIGKDSIAVKCSHCSREPSKSNHATDTSPAKGEDSSDKNGSDTDSSNESDEISEWNSAEESWSEGSTEVDELGNPLTSSDEPSSTGSEAEIESDGESEASQDDAVSDTAINHYGQLYEESDSDGGDVDFDPGSDNESYDGDHESDMSDENNHEEDLHFDTDDEDRLVRQMAYSRQDKKRDAKIQQGVLKIYDLAANPPTQIFTFTHQLPIMLYDSPPSIHPTKSLVVWPLCGGDVLFADYEAKSYFIRRARTTTRKTRHVFMKCHFSPCSKYLHIASLEAQTMKQSKSDLKEGTKPRLALSTFITTHRLSTRKTTRSPTTLIHRVKVNLGITTSLSPTRMPVEVTWAENEVYLSTSSDTNHLTLLRVNLFPPAKDVTPSEHDAVSIPKLPILLPESAHSRSVHYYPPQTNSTRALIIIGSWAGKSELDTDVDKSKPAPDAKSDTDVDKSKPAPDAAPNERDTDQDLPETVSPPMGFYIDVQKDLGGWRASDKEEAIEKDKDKGQLKQKMDIFAADDDCCIEHYFFTKRR